MEFLTVEVRLHVYSERRWIESMATIVNNPGTTTDNSSGMGFVLGILLLLVIAFLFFVYGLPAISRSVSGPTLNVPGQVDVNVNTPNTGGK
jgi:hypothetical protein